MVRSRSRRKRRCRTCLCFGGKDKEAGTVSVRHRSEGDLGAVPADEFVASVIEEIKTKALGPAATAIN